MTQRLSPLRASRLRAPSLFLPPYPSRTCLALFIVIVADSFLFVTLVFGQFRLPHAGAERGKNVDCGGSSSRCPPVALISVVPHSPLKVPANLQLCCIHPHVTSKYVREYPRSRLLHRHGRWHRRRCSLPRRVDVHVEFALSPPDSRYKIGAAYSFPKNGLTTAST